MGLLPTFDTVTDEDGHRPGLGALTSTMVWDWADKGSSAGRLQHEDGAFTNVKFVST